ncbi:MAG TPA: hypothetical protein VIX73_05485 [Kofleriaceae bacterium]|jgi:hypothetical protein
MRLFGVLLVIAGCHFEGMPPGGTPDGSTEPDMSPPATGMVLNWIANPALPGQVTDKVEVTDAVFQLEHLQLVSDAGADARTTRSRYQLEWKDGAAPAQEVFPDAPVAVYQRISLDLRPDVQPPFAYQVLGVWHDEDEDKPFKIADPVLLEIPIDCSVSLPAGSSVSITVRLDLRDALNSVDFKTLQEINGVLVLSTAGPMLSQFRSKLTRAFHSDD